MAESEKFDINPKEVNMQLVKLIKVSVSMVNESTKGCELFEEISIKLTGSK